jgi:hypothetical protein
MIRVSTVRRLVAALVCACALATASSAPDRKFSTSDTLKTEATTLVKLLEQAHYARDSVRSLITRKSFPTIWPN